MRIVTCYRQLFKHGKLLQISCHTDAAEVAAVSAKAKQRTNRD